MSYSATTQLGAVEGGCRPSEYRTVLVDARGAITGLGPCVAVCPGYEVITETGKECHLLPSAAVTTAPDTKPISWSPLLLAGAAALAFLIVLH